jgi:hypothetical protein
MTIGRFNKKVVLLSALLIILSITGFYLVFAPNAPDLFSAHREETRLLALLDETGAELSSAKVTGWVKVSKSTGSAILPQELTTIAAQELDLSLTAVKPESWENAYAKGNEITGLLRSGDYVSVTGQVMNYPTGEQAAHVMINVTLNDCLAASKVKKQVKKTLRKFGKDERIALTISGKLEVLPGEPELIFLAEKLMAQLEGEVRERVVKENMVSLTGSSPHLGNINIALRRSYSEEAVLIHIATPVIMAEY